MSCTGDGSEGPFFQGLALENRASVDDETCKCTMVSSSPLDTELAHEK